MSLRKILSGTATLAVFIVGMAAFLAAQDMPYPMLENLTFAGWLALSAAIVFVIAVPGLIVYCLFHLLLGLPGYLARRLSPELPNPTQPSPLAPAAVDPTDIDDEWADIRREIAAAWAEGDVESEREKR